MIEVALQIMCSGEIMKLILLSFTRMILFAQLTSLQMLLKSFNIRKKVNNHLNITGLLWTKLQYFPFILKKTNFQKRKNLLKVVHQDSKS